MTHHIDLATITLAKGGHGDRALGVCLLEAVAWWAHEPHSDQPQCVSPILADFGRQLNDVLPDGKRQALKQYIPRMVATDADGLDETRGYLALDWLIRTYTPAWLDLAGMSAEAQTLRDLRQIVDLSAAEAAGPVVREARSKAAAAWAAAWAAAGDATWAAAGDAARDAARAAARDAARDAAWDAAWDAAGAAAWAAAWAAAGDATWAAARDAARDRLKPTVDQLQDSAIALFAHMLGT